MSVLVNTARRKSSVYSYYYCSNHFYFGSSSSSSFAASVGSSGTPPPPLIRFYTSPPRQRRTSPSSSSSHRPGGLVVRRSIHSSATVAAQQQGDCAGLALGHNNNNNVVTTTKPKRTIHAVYALGEGWTGALGTGRLDQDIAGHLDGDDLQMEYRRTSHLKSSPACMYEGSGAVLSCAVGWAHSALVVAATAAEKEPAPLDSQRLTTNELMMMPPQQQQQQHNYNKLLVTGRPHEFLSVLRLRRQPQWLRQYASNLLYRTTHGSSADVNGYHPTELIGRTLQFLAEVFVKDNNLNWELMRKHSFLTIPTEIPIPAKIYYRHKQHEQRQLPSNYNNNNNHALMNPEDEPPTEMRLAEPLSVACGAGVTAVTCADGRVYTFGLNGMGQCGIGRDSNNVWTPTAVTGLSSQFDMQGDRTALRQSHPIQNTVLGLQHGLCVNAAGEIFSWGKGERGQLGHEHGALDEKESHTAQPIQRVVVNVADAGTGKPEYDRLGPVAQIASGMIHCAALEQDTNRVFLWGKNLLPPPPHDKGAWERKIATDARLPFLLHGLPQKQVLQIACGSHHTSVLLEDGSVWAVGLATDTVKPLHKPVCLIEPGIIDLPVRQFVAHMDRTTVVTATGEVLQAHLWEQPENRAYAVFIPAWIDDFLAETCEPGTRIRQVHRSWLHTLVVTERDVDW